MIFQRRKVATALACIAGVGGAMAVTGAFAQAQNPDVPSLTRQPAPDIRVEVTGSNIKRVEGEGALPVTVITRQEIERSGATTPMELLQQISANNSFGAVNIANSVGATTLSAQTASLRGLGGGRTLVLLNGHRLEGFSGEIQGVQGVNLSAIPFAAIERVEILKDGASAIYGSDAIAGVINFITRTDYAGAEVTGMYGTPTRGGGGDQWQASVSAGWGDLARDRWNVFVSGSYNEQKSLDQVDRNFSNSSYRPEIGLIGLSSNTFPGRITTGGIGAVLNGVVINDQPPDVAARLCRPSTFENDDIVGTNCYFDPSNVKGVNMIPHEKTYNFFGSGAFQINRDWQAYAMGLYSHDESRLIIQPGPVSNLFSYGPGGNLTSTVTIQPDSPFYPHAAAQEFGVDGQPLNVRYRTFDNGLRDTTDTNEHWQVIGGVKGSWMNWDWDGSFNYAEGTTSEHLNGGFQDYRLLLPLLNSGRVNLFGPNTPDIVNELRATNFIGDTITGTSKLYGGQLKTSGEIWKLPAGSLAMAVGVEARHESLDQNMAEAIQEGFITGYGGEIKNVSGSRNQWAAFTEFNIPIVKNLEGDVAVRYDHYSDFGSTTNPKFSLRWHPVRTFLVRGSYGTGFLAPSLYELFTPNISGVSQPGLSDPIRCPVTGDTGFDCSTQFGVLFGGNRNLKPEESEQTTAGIVWEPFANASVSVDWFKINLKNAIQNGISPLTILGDLGQFGNLVTRAPAEPGSPLPGRILSILQTYVNLGAVKIQGIDLEGHYRTPIQSWGRLSFDGSGTYYTKYDAQNPDGTFTGQVGTALGTVVTGIIPRWKQYTSFTWDLGPWSATLANTYQTSYTDQQTDLDGNERTVGSLSIWDLQGSYTGFKNWKLTLGVKNLFDRNPPVSNQQSTFIVGFDPSYYDPRARFVYGSVTYTFK
ncbi:MAG TPA: TonB-dependent receptor [Casimicrobiaceae bacterium]|nr:TonB-dependent receptor [Casimicrobiaceae bacterium]